VVKYQLHFSQQRSHPRELSHSVTCNTKVQVLLKSQRSMSQRGVASKTSRTQYEAITSTSRVARLATLTISPRCHRHIGQLMPVVGESSLLIRGAKGFSSQAAHLLRLKLNGYKPNYCAQRPMAGVQRS
jgi:hypothetical protein